MESPATERLAAVIVAAHALADRGRAGMPSPGCWLAVNDLAEAVADVAGVLRSHLLSQEDK